MPNARRRSLVAASTAQGQPPGAELGLFGRVGDVMGVPVALLSLVAILLLTLPLSWRVQKSL
jgi:hypothetical protein